MKPRKPTPKTKANTLRHPGFSQQSRKRERESKTAKPAKKARQAMTATHNDADTARAVDKDRNSVTAHEANQSQRQAQRGAGSGEHAVATRGRNYNQSAADYPKGDIDKGRIDYDKLSEGQTAEIIPARDRRAYLIDQAEKNEAANDELNAIQTDQNKRLQFAQNMIQDPDEMRDSSMETAINALKMHDPDVHNQVAEHRRELAAKHVHRGERNGAPLGTKKDDDKK